MSNRYDRLGEGFGSRSGWVEILLTVSQHYPLGSTWGGQSKLTQDPARLQSCRLGLRTAL